jgi:hypothetical protein
MATLVRPPPSALKTRRGGKYYWTIHTSPNNVFTVWPREDAPTAIVGFKKPEHALMIGQMIETHYIRQREWPNTMGRLLLPAPMRTGVEDLNFLFLQRWDFENLKVACTKNFLNMVSVEGLETTKDGFNFDGKLLSFEGSTDFLVESLKEMYERPGPTPDL